MMITTQARITWGSQMLFLYLRNKQQQKDTTKKYNVLLSRSNCDALVNILCAFWYLILKRETEKETARERERESNKSSSCSCYECDYRVTTAAPPQQSCHLSTTLWYPVPLLKNIYFRMSVDILNLSPSQCGPVYVLFRVGYNCQCSNYTYTVAPGGAYAFNAT